MLNNRFAAVAAAAVLAGFAYSPANAADLGGDCCADLEERVAELEATTVRKGNRKVSLKVSGFVAQQVLYWDDGVEENTYITDTGSISIGSHVAFSGKAQISSDIDAGFLIKLEVINADSLLVSQGADDGIVNPGGNAQAALTGTTGAVAVESVYWYLNSRRLGRLSIGTQSSAVDNQAILPDGSGSLIQSNYVLYDTNAFFLRRSDGTLASAITWGRIANCHSLNQDGGTNGDCDGVPNNNIRYDSPTIAGFSMSASWGEDDIWGVSGRYAGKIRDVKVSAAIAYGESTDESGSGSSVNANATANGGLDVAHLQLGGYLEHMPTGLFVYAAWSKEYLDVTSSVRGAGLTNPEGDSWFIKAGVKRDFIPLGSTTIFGAYGEIEDRFTAAIYDAGVDSTRMDQVHVGVVQNVDAAAMQLWAVWKHYEVDDITCADAVNTCASVGLDNGVTSFEDMDIFKVGGLIVF